MSEQQLYFIHALSPLHAGTGQGTGTIDLPILREKATNIPLFPGSSMKGTLRSACSNEDEANKLFGKPGDFGFAGSAQFSDARLLLLPVRSIKGVFAWVTCPYVLNRFCRDSLQQSEEWDIKVNECIVFGNSVLLNKDNFVYLEELDLKAKTKTELSTIEHLKSKFKKEWNLDFEKRLCVVSDDVFNFLLTTSMEIVARIKIDEKLKITQKGSLWYEEALPVESILYGIVVLSLTPSAEVSEKYIKEKLSEMSNISLQLGGKTTVGRGLCRIGFSDI